jgi:hypothetical protein
LIWSNANPATVLYVPPCVLTSISCLDLEQYKPCNCFVCSSVCGYIYICSRSRQDIDVRTHGGTYRTVAGFVLLQIKTGYRCMHTRRNIQNSCRVCIPATVLYVPPCVLTSISCLDLEQCKPCNCSVCSSVYAYIYILSWSVVFKLRRLYSNTISPYSSLFVRFFGCKILLFLIAS